MITLALTYRNRELNIVKRCLDSLQKQTINNFEVIIVDYGSTEYFSDGLSELVKEYWFIKLIYCPVKGQLWNKSRAINIALQQTNTPYFLVGDIDLIFKEDFIKTAIELAKEDKVTYFQYGFLSKTESESNKSFLNYKIAFLGNDEVTGTTLFPSDQLKKVNGYDEFYHGWGAEDTDIHIRIKQLGLPIYFYKKEVLVKHQWHQKAYRSKHSTAPFHSEQERINHFYIQLTKNTNRLQANEEDVWGKIPSEDVYTKLLQKPNYIIEIDSANFKVEALIAQLNNFNDELVVIVIKDVSKKLKIKQLIKRILGKKHIFYMVMETINNRLLEEIIIHYRNLPYQYSFNRQTREINLTIKF